MMRSDKLGYNAPIVVYKRKYYKYDDPNYTITDVPIDNMDLDILTESVEMLRQFKDFSLFSELSGVIQKLEDKIYREPTKLPPIIHLDKNEQLTGLEHLDVLYQAILKKIVLDINYQSFKARNPSIIKIQGYILKEFNNRWFFVGKKLNDGKLLTLALDRMIAIDFDTETDFIEEEFDADEYYKNTIGVTVLNDKQLQTIELRIDRSIAPYILTKPLHHSQEHIGDYPDQSVKIRLRVHHNFELERLLLGFGSSIEVLKPRRLKNNLIKHYKEALEKYEK